MGDGGKAVGPLGYSVDLRNDQSFTDASHYRKGLWTVTLIIVSLRYPYPYTCTDNILSMQISK
jgi:hypothetical protein